MRKTASGSSEHADRDPSTSDHAAGSAEQRRDTHSGKSRPLLLGHRGARQVSRGGSRARAAEIPPENTIAAFQYALGHGCDGFEFDVRITRDERLVLCHDARLGGRNVAASSYDSLCAGWPEALPCLEDVLTAFGDRAYLDIEVKVLGGEELILNALRKNEPRQFLLSSFLPEVLRRFHQLDPSLPLGYICDRPADVHPWRELPIQVFLPHYELVDEELIREVHSRGMQLFTWTVNREDDLQRLATWGVDGLISDDPALLYRTVRRLAPSGQKPRSNS